MNRKFLLIVGLLLLSVGVSAKRVGAYCYFANNGSHLYEDDIVKVELTMDNMNLALVIYNKTEDVIYLDNKNSFIIYLTVVLFLMTSPNNVSLYENNR